MKKNVLSVVALAVLLAFCLTGCGGNKPNESANDAANNETSTVENDANGTTEESDGYAHINAFIDAFNASGDFSITDIKQVDDIASKDSPYFREIYLTSSFTNAVGVIATIEGCGQIDIVSYGVLSYDSICVYADANSKEKAATLFKKIADVVVYKLDKNSEYEDFPDIEERIVGSATFIKNYDNAGSVGLGPGYNAGYYNNEVYVDATDLA